MEDRDNIRTKTTEETRITDLDMDVTVEIVSRMAEGGMKDLVNAESASKHLNIAGEYDKVYHDVALPIFPTIPWYPEPYDGRPHFLQRIRECKHPEVAFSDEIMAFFADDCMAIQRAKDILTISASEGHLASMYTLGMLKVMKHGQSGVEEGTLLLTQLWYKRCVVTCRKKVSETALGALWPARNRRPSNGLSVNKICKFKGACKGWRIRKGSWVFNDETDDYSDHVCINCRLDEEVMNFANKWTKLQVY